MDEDLILILSQTAQQKGVKINYLVNEIVRNALKTSS